MKKLNKIDWTYGTQSNKQRIKACAKWLTAQQKANLKYKKYIQNVGSDNYMQVYNELTNN